MGVQISLYFADQLALPSLMKRRRRDKDLPSLLLGKELMKQAPSKKIQPRRNIHTSILRRKRTILLTLSKPRRPRLGEPHPCECQVQIISSVQ
jgi:hypothetical protein